MDYKVLYRKYRPTNFNELVGQDHIKEILVNSIINDKIAHAYIFTGPRGTGKTSTAKIFAKTLNCLNVKDGIACGECENCINLNTSPDIIEMDAASNNSVDDIRNIIENVSLSSTSGKYKIYIIDEVHMLTASAWNAFLKTLEEPPKNVVFILATTDIQKVPITVLSRCQRFDFQRIDRTVIAETLKNICKLESINIDNDSLNEIAFLSDGCLRDALSILDQLSKLSDDITMDVIKVNYGTVTKEDIDYLYNYILRNDIDGLVNQIYMIKETGIDIKILIDKLLENFIIKAVQMKKKNVSNNAFNQLKKIIDSLNELSGRLNSNSNGFLMLELELLSFINDDNNRITNREIDQIISREIISLDTQVDVNSMIKDNNNAKYYNITDDFTKVRINNTFVDASKDAKVKAFEDYKKVIDSITKEDNKEFSSIIKKITLQVASDEYILFLANTDSIKIVGNSKLFEFENLFKRVTDHEYKIMFINKKDWDSFMNGFDKTKKYELMSEDPYINKGDSSVSMAKELFGSETINVE